MWIVSESLDEVVTVDRAELDVFESLLGGKLARRLIGDVKVPPIVHVHPNFKLRTHVVILSEYVTIKLHLSAANS
jgi:hypothetical protein